MAQIFPDWANKAPFLLLAGASLGTLLTLAGVWYYFSPEFTDVGYQPEQPVPFSHRLHVGELQMDCRYCHATVEVSAVASIPPTQTCLNCHQLVSRDSEKLAPMRKSVAKQRSLRWVRVHKLPEYAYFDHSLHLRAGIGCSSCHGNVAQMEIIRQVESLSMSWCLDCHRDPYNYVRPPDRITDTTWLPADSPVDPQDINGGVRLDPPTDCSGCHR